MKTDRIACDVLVIGSGPGGALTALLLSRAGRDVILAEEGTFYDPGKFKPYSLEEMGSKYRCEGMTMAFGDPHMNYVEACCVGGASEINAGLYHRPIPEIINQWAEDFQVRDFSHGILMPYFQNNEEILDLTTSRQGLGPGSQILKDGADKLGWKGLEIPRMWDYGSNPLEGQRRPMSTSLIPDAVAAGCKLFSSSRAQRIYSNGAQAEYVLLQDGKKIYFNHLFICGGAVQTPFLLRRSGIKRNIGNSLRAHPAIRALACFDKTAGDEKEGVPVYQIAEFKPWLTLGGSFSALPHLALWMAGKKSFSPKDFNQNMGLFYALIMAEGHGRIRHLPMSKNPLVFFNLTDPDLKALGEGLYRLGELLFAAGAKKVFSPLNDQQEFKDLKEMSYLRQGILRSQMEISTLHLFSSCPMGEIDICPVDSWGKLHDLKNLYINDASILPGPPGVNPQALIMAIARRNAVHWLARH